MKDLKDLKVGDKAFIPVEIVNVSVSGSYPIHAKMNGGAIFSFTLGGKSSVRDLTPSLFLTNPFEQQGKEMLVKTSEYDWRVRDVIVTSNGIYVKSGWLEAKEIEPTQVELTLEQIAEKFGCDVNQLKIKK